MRIIPSTVVISAQVLLALWVGCPTSTLAQAKDTTAVADSVDWDEAPTVTQWPPSNYPASAIADSAEGKVMLKIFLNAEGRVTQTEIYKSSGRSDLDSAALKSGMHFQYTPAKKNGRAIPTFVTQCMKYRMK